MQLQKKVCFITSVVASVSSAGVTSAHSTDVLPQEIRAYNTSVFENELAPKTSSPEQLTLARLSAIDEAFAAYLDYAPDVDALSAQRRAKIRRAFDQDLGKPDEIAFEDLKPTFLKAD